MPTPDNLVNINVNIPNINEQNPTQSLVTTFNLAIALGKSDKTKELFELKATNIPIAIITNPAACNIIKTVFVIYPTSFVSVYSLSTNYLVVNEPAKLYIKEFNFI